MWHTTCCTCRAPGVLHVICIRLRPAHLSIRVGDSSWHSNESVKNSNNNNNNKPWTAPFNAIIIFLFYSILFYSRLCPSIAGSSPPPDLQLLYPLLFCPHRSLLPHNVNSPTTFWSSDWSYSLYLPLCASHSPYITFHSGDVSSPVR